MVRNMAMSFTLIFVAALSSIVCSVHRAENSQQVDSLGAASTPGGQSVSASVMPDEDHLRRLILFLSSDNEDERRDAQAKLLEQAKQSPQQRQAVIRELTLAAEKLGLENRLVLDSDTFRFWSSATRIFSTLRAVETIELLIKYIYCGDGSSQRTAHHRPAEDALLELGSLAVPELSEALLTNENPTVRGHVALCLGNIGGLEARQALEQANQSETDQGVAHSIRLALSAIDRESH